MPTKVPVPPAESNTTPIQAVQTTGHKVDLYALSQAKLQDENGKEVPAGSLWHSQKVVMVFLRHFACIACRAHAVQVWGLRENYEKNGAKVVFVGNGPAGFIKSFKEDLHIQSASVYTDPSLISFRACGFKHGFLNVVKPASLANAAGLMLQGHRQKLTTQDTGDHWQLGGVVVITPKNEVPFHFISESLGHYPPEKDVIARA
jgi:hypothetical protein